MTAAAITSRPAAVRIGAVAALVGGGLLLTKVALIIASGNRLPGALAGGLYLAGVVLPLVAAAGVAAALKPGAGKPAKIGLGVLVAVAHLFYLMILSDGVGALVQSFTATKYLVDEVPIAVAGLAWVLIGLWLSRRNRAA